MMRSISTGVDPSSPGTVASWTARINSPASGGNWFTGYARHGDEWFVFAGVGVAGRTGHDYENHWVGSELHWRGKTGSRLGQPAVESLLRSPGRVHVFTRAADRDPFTYQGAAVAVRAEDTEPVTIVWRFPGRGRRRAGTLPEEVVAAGPFPEGAVTQVTVNRYERSAEARAACVRHYGAACRACGLDFGAAYGELAAGYIHVHHLVPLAEVGEGYAVDPVKDLRPVCPNCHAVIHLEDPPLTIETVRWLLAARRGCQGDGGEE